MKTIVTNSIHFDDGLDTNFCRHFKKIFPEEDYEINIFKFDVELNGKTSYKMSLGISVEYQGKAPAVFTYEKTTFDVQMIEAIKHGKDFDLNKRKCILNMVSNDTFIEELDEFLTELENC